MNTVTTPHHDAGPAAHDITSRLESAMRCQKCPYADQVDDLMRSNDSLQQVNRQLKTTRDQLTQSERLASIGQLAAGVAHEINNPVGYVFSNFGTLQKVLADLFSMLDAYEQAEPLLAGTPAAASLAGLRRSIDLDYLKEDVPALMNESLEGLTRVRKIVQDLKDFSRVDARQEWEWTDLRRGLDSTLNIVNNEIKYKADVVREYGHMPDVQCLASEINQVFMNLLVNAAHAIDKARGTITIRCGHDDGPDGGTVWIQIEDDGCGIAAENLQRIFDPFFTTKPVGKGTGLGLSISYAIVEQHGGELRAENAPEGGAVFVLSLPLGG